MKLVIITSIAALAGCTSQPQASCPAIEKFAQRDAVADARASLAKGDRHLLMLGGFDGSTPGVANSDAYPKQMMEGTSDTTTEACSGKRRIAEAYATRYNHTVAASASN